METNNQVPTLQEHKKIGPIVVTLVIVLVLVVVALYMFASKIGPQDKSDTNNYTNATTTIVQPQEVPVVTNTADDPQSLKNDLNTSVQGLDSQNF